MIKLLISALLILVEAAVCGAAALNCTLFKGFLIFWPVPLTHIILWVKVCRNVLFTASHDVLVSVDCGGVWQLTACANSCQRYREETAKSELNPFLFTLEHKENDNQHTGSVFVQDKTGTKITLSRSVVYLSLV